jgi:hypothetical protein
VATAFLACGPERILAMRQWTSFLVLSTIVLVGVARQTNADEEETPHSIIDRALKAGGGVEKIRQFKAVSGKAEMKSGETTIHFRGVFAGPTLFRLEMGPTEDGTFVIIGGGDTFWVKKGKEPFKECRRASSEFHHEQAIRLFYALSLPDQLLTVKSKGYKLTIMGDQAVNGVQAIALRVKHELHPEALMYFDKESGLPVKTQMTLPPPTDGLAALLAKPGDELLEIYFENYKEVNGVQHFTRIKIRCGDEVMEGDLRELKLLKTIDSGTFKKPS